MAATKQSSIEQAKGLLILAAEYDVRVSTARGLVTLTKTFAAGDTAAYIEAESQVGEMMLMVPQTYAGSTWGTTSDGVGGAAGLTGGYMKLKMSGVSKRFLNALSRLL